MSSLTTSRIPTPTSTAPPGASTSTDPNKNNDGPTSRPLLFFVALGFGVVFTNLWIIVGVKYCFRYNQRARQAMLAEQNGDTIDMGNMRQPRRRREKKLMSMEEVNERFPLTKYKVWRASREQEGLPTTGGITAPPSRAGSIRERFGDLKRVSTEDGAAISDQPTGNAGGARQLNTSSETRDFAADTINPQASNVMRESEDRSRVPQIRVEAPNDEPQKTRDSVGPVSTSTPLARVTSTENEVADEEEDDPTRSAIPNPVLDTSQPGDACAICIDSLDEDDEVRGLTCGHAFHASCIDPWLTSRRACCPLCKADYYIPKTRTEGDPASAGAEGTSLPRNPPATLQRPRLFFGGFMFGGSGRPGWPVGIGQRTSRVPRFRQRAAQGVPTAQLGEEGGSAASGETPTTDITTGGNPTGQTAPTPSRTSRFTNLVQSGRSRFSRFSRRNANTGETHQPEAQPVSAPPTAEVEAATTPGQLEAGTRS